MSDTGKPPSQSAETFIPHQLQEQLKEILDMLPHPISLYLFRKADEQDQPGRVAEQMLEALQDVSSKILFAVHDLDHELAREWGVDRSPTLVFAPDRYAIRYLGVPLGEEGRTLMETLILLGLGDSQLGQQARKAAQKIDSPRAVKVFVSPTCPYCPQQAVNAVKAAIERPGIISVEIVDIQFNPDLAERYSAFSVPQVYAGETLIAQGAQSEELFLASLEAMEQKTVFIPDSDAPLIETDLVIVGGGPAGLTAGIYAARSGLKSVVVERASLGGQVATTPIVENYPGLTRVTGKSLVDIMVTHALEYVQIFQKEEVVDIKPGDPIEVLTSRRRFSTRAVLLATGANYKRLGIPGEDRFAGRGVSYCTTCDGPLFKDRDVVMVGGGNSAVTEALHLHHIGARVTLVHRRDTLRAQEQLVRDLNANGIPILWNTELKEIRGDDRVQEIQIFNSATGETSILKTDGVFVAIGYAPAVELADKIGVELTAFGFIKHDNHRTNVPGVYSAGDVEGGYKQIVTAAGQGAESAMVIYEDLSRPYWKEARPGAAT